MEERRDRAQAQGTKLNRREEGPPESIEMPWGGVLGA